MKLIPSLLVVGLGVAGVWWWRRRAAPAGAAVVPDVSSATGRTTRDHRSPTA